MTNHFEAKKHAYRQTQDGVVVSFVIHPSEIPNDLAIASLGTRYMVAFSEIGDNEKPVPGPIAQRTEQQTSNLSVEGSNPSRASTKDRRPFSTLPLSQQAAIRCHDKEFQTFLAETFPNAWKMNGADAPATVRQVCQVESRSEFDTAGSAALDWEKVDLSFQEWLTDQRYAGSKR